MSNVITIEVDNRRLLLAVDYLYREHMKMFETQHLLPASKVLMDQLAMSVKQMPVEGYYTESEELRAYFLNIRTLQQLFRADTQPIAHLDAYQQLSKVMSSAIYGAKPDNEDGFFPQRLDSFYFALDTTEPGEWQVETLTNKAHAFAVTHNDISLVGLAALIKDAVVLAALRESVVLYASIVAGAALEPPTYEYVWNVTGELENKVNQFIDLFNVLTSSNIRKASAEHTAYFYDAYQENDIWGRCVYIGFDDSKEPKEYYHWAINYSAQGDDFIVDAFWDTEIWTTEQYHDKRL